MVAAHITQARREIFYPERRRRTRELERGRAVRMGLATPSDPFRDPYIVASLIALAQEQARLALKDSPGSELSGARKFPVSHPSAESRHCFAVHTRFSQRTHPPLFRSACS